MPVLPRTCRPRCVRRRNCSPPARSPRRRSARMSSRITPTLRASSWRRTTPLSPTGNVFAASNGCDAMTTHDVINPATEEVVQSLELFDVEQTDAAVARSRAAFAGWRTVSPGDRARLLRRFADAVDADRENLAQLEVANSGHTIGNARWEAG